MKVVATERLPIKMWLDDIEDGALDQAKNLANLPFVFKHIAIMPDTHQGYGMPLGGIMATRGVIIPNAVGVDIGCGMCAVKTTLKGLDQEKLKKIMGEIRKSIPVGFNKHKEPQSIGLLPTRSDKDDMPVVYREFENAQKSVGTLGGGNHFIEIQEDEDGFIWVMIHSGSRNLGLKVAKYYNDLAKELNKKWHTSVPEEQQLAFLPIHDLNGQSYIREMNYCVEFAQMNRETMMEQVKNAIQSILKTNEVCIFDEEINIAHNYAQMENHFGQNVMIHRKGATLATKDTIGIIPGSQGSSSYIVRGKGDPDSFNSCSHGAGRRMGRKQAQRELNLEEEIQRLDDMGVIHGIRGSKQLDEATGAYKDIHTVMGNQEDLVEVLHTLTPLAVIKA